jgi:glycosyltransferase involved in cell wall biosynthesis
VDTEFKIDILLPTYNGAEYLGELLESIATQDIDEWRLIIRDDGSEDGSVSIINNFVSEYSDRAIILPDTTVRLGVVASYEYLLTKSSLKYVAFCDQDDVWMPDKLRKLRDCMVLLEKEYGSDTPFLVHSDLRVVNESLEVIADSFWKYQKLNPERMQSLHRLLLQNCVTGCAALVNRSLVERALPIPDNSIMHDWWLALIAISCGKVKQIDIQTVKYRQHSRNDTGAKKWGFKHVIDGVFRNRRLYINSINKTRKQAEALLLSGKLGYEQSKIVSQYIDMFKLGWFSRRLKVIRMGFLKYGFIRNIALMIWL